MDSLKNFRTATSALGAVSAVGPRLWAAVILTALLLAAGMTGQAQALPLTCAQVGGVGGANCTLSVPFNSAVDFALAIPGDLLIANGGSLNCNDPAAPSSANACNITITVGGDMVMKAGSAIFAENRVNGGNGGDITIDVDGDMTLCKTNSALVQCAPASGAVGAKISSSKTTQGVGTAGDITITVGNFPNTPPIGVFTMEPGTQILADAGSTQSGGGGSGGAIVITAGKVMDIDGLVRSYGGLTGVGGVQPPGGGPITLKSGCQLAITPDGVVSSEGRDPGADLVHLEGCEVTINGIVRSIALGNGGHALPNNPANHCNLDTVTHPAVNKFTACVEVWANNITINSILPNKGEVSADGVTDNTANDTRAWIDLYAKHNITINNDNVGPYSVHANAGGTEGDFGGLITIKAELGKYVSTGATPVSPSFAVQANALTQSGHGGEVIIQAFLDVALNASFVQAQGALVGTNRTGGEISVQSFNGFVLGNAPGALTANAGTVIGAISLQGCGTGAGGGKDGATSYTGATTPPADFKDNACGGQPTLPDAVLAALETLADVCAQAPDCVAGACNKSGRKFNDIAGQPGLPNWQICVFDSAGTLGPCTLTGANGNYAFTNLACGETLTFCEVLQDGWTQTFPTLPSADPRIVTCQGLVGPGPDPLGPVGYEETLVEGVPSENNDFGNTRPPGECPENTPLAPELTRCVIDTATGLLHPTWCGNPPRYATLQQAYDAAGDGEVIGMFIKTNENVWLGGEKSLTIAQCASAQITAVSNTKPVVDVNTTGQLTIIGLDTVKGSIGWLVESNGHNLKAVRATDALQVGIKVTGDNNSVSCNSVSGSPIGIRIKGAFNNISCVVRNNNGDGILVEGASNTLDGNRVSGNKGNGIHVTSDGTNTCLKGNRSGSPENVLAEYLLDIDAIDCGGNQADGTSIPKPTKCPTFPAAGFCE